MISAANHVPLTPLSFLTRARRAFPARLRWWTSTSRPTGCTSSLCPRPRRERSRKTCCATGPVNGLVVRSMRPAILTLRLAGEREARPL
jgi:hypothetical protein